MELVGTRPTTTILDGLARHDRRSRGPCRAKVPRMVQ